MISMEAMSLDEAIFRVEDAIKNGRQDNGIDNDHLATWLRELRMRRQEEEGKFFREHRRTYAESMETMVLVRSVVDIVKHYESDPLTKGYFKNIRIDQTTRRDHRDPQDEWGADTYMVVADFDGYTGQCIGYSNFKE